MSYPPHAGFLSLFDESDAYLLDSAPARLNDVSVFISARTALPATAWTPLDCIIFSQLQQQPGHTTRRPTSVQNIYKQTAER